MPRATSKARRQKKSLPRKKSATKARASWRGMVRFGLVSFPVEAFNAHALDADHIALNQLHAECHSRIQYQKVCPIHGQVDNDEIVSGYEFSKGRYVEIDPQELDSLRTDQERSLTIDAFITPDEIDVLYFDGRMYYLSPDGDQAREPYTVFLDALRRQDRWGVGQIVFSGKEQVVVVRPYHDALHMALLNYEAEMRDPAETVGALAEIRSADKKVRLAEQLIENWTEPDFDFSGYKDTYVEKMRALIDAKIEGREMVVPEVEEEPSVINFTDALQKSLARPSARTARESGRRNGAQKTPARRAKPSKHKRRNAG